MELENLTALQFITETSPVTPVSMLSLQLKTTRQISCVYELHVHVPTHQNIFCGACFVNAKETFRLMDNYSLSIMHGYSFSVQCTI